MLTRRQLAKNLFDKLAAGYLLPLSIAYVCSFSGKYDDLPPDDYSPSSLSAFACSISSRSSAVSASRLKRSSSSEGDHMG